MKPYLKHLSSFVIALILLVAPPPSKAANPPANDSTFAVEDLDTRPVRVAGKQPQYPREMRKVGVPGYVVVEFIINPTGDVIAMQVLESSNMAFEMPALQAVKDWKFEPGKRNKRAVSVRAVERLEFDAPKK